MFQRAFRFKGDETSTQGLDTVDDAGKSGERPVDVGKYLGSTPYPDEIKIAMIILLIRMI